MAKTGKSHTTPHWLKNLRELMTVRGFNPRSLSLNAGLNPTAVRDMLDGRTNFPRYDTAQALAQALGTTPAQLMGDNASVLGTSDGNQSFDDNLDLLVEIIARLQEITLAQNRKVSPRDFATMAATIYKQMQNDGTSGKKMIKSVQPKIHDLLEYETLRQRAAR
ncbi:MAG: helix-turn-helix transcriptional regulator [Alphaproteobacteria bacterium]|nr:helix-turn-helix transcriptional regulator [Alphaproteobacteria bacterium]